MIAENNMKGFTPGMAALDAVPVLLFGGGSAVLSELIGGRLFPAGSGVCAAAGLCKVAWKTAVALGYGDIKVLNSAFRTMMPAGFALMLAGASVRPKRTAAAIAKLCGFPQAVWITAGLAGLSAMGIMAKRLDFEKPEANWLGEVTNLLSQGAIFIGFSIVR